ncbi:hypothetical protein, partial [Methylocystis sp.]|uniref:hypothetical protein n=1 Tax=Methylocystis sp. TaxID=1911079 RepID=UPI0025FD8B34
VAIPVVTTLDALPDERCPVCAKPIEQKSGRGGKRVYCSTRCANAYHNGETAKASAKARAALKCTRCAAPILGARRTDKKLCPACKRQSRLEISRRHRQRLKAGETGKRGRNQFSPTF